MASSLPIVSTQTERRTIACCLWLAAANNQEIFRGLCRYAREHTNWSLIPVDLREERDCASLKRSGIDGLVLQIFDRRLLAWAKSFRVPTVSVSQHCPDAAIPIVASDDEMAGRMAAEYFLARGYRHFAFYGREGHPTSEHRQRGFTERITEAGAKCNVMTTKFTYRARQLNETFMEELAPWIESLPRPSALFGWSDQACVPMLNMCDRLGIKVPTEIGILGAGNDPMRQSATRVDLSSIALGMHAIGYEAGKVLAGLFAGEAVPSTPVLVPPVRVISRQSTDWLAVEDERIQKAVLFIRKNSHRVVYVQELTKVAGLSRRPLEKLFQRVLGHSPLNLINQFRVERAKELLVSSKLKLELISSLCGFADGRRLSISFKQVTGETPSAFRQRNLAPD